MRYKSGDLCVIHSKTSSHNGKVVEVVNYTKQRCTRGTNKIKKKR